MPVFLISSARNELLLSADGEWSNEDAEKTAEVGSKDHYEPRYTAA